jgi:hypothetical protein
MRRPRPLCAVPPCLGILLASLFLLLPAAAQIPMPMWTKQSTRGWAMAKDSVGRVYPVADQTALIWLDKPEFRRKLEEALVMANRAPVLSADQVRQMNFVIKKLGRPDVRRQTDLNGSVFFDGALLQQKALFIIVNLKPISEGGGVYVGTKDVNSFQAKCTPVTFDDLVTKLQRF